MLQLEVSPAAIALWPPNYNRNDVVSFLTATQQIINHPNTLLDLKCVGWWGPLYALASSRTLCLRVLGFGSVGTPRQSRSPATGHLAHDPRQCWCVRLVPRAACAQDAAANDHQADPGRRLQAGGARRRDHPPRCGRGSAARARADLRHLSTTLSHAPNALVCRRTHTPQPS